MAAAQTVQAAISLVGDLNALRKSGRLCDLKIEVSQWVNGMISKMPTFKLKFGAV